MRPILRRRAERAIIAAATLATLVLIALATDVSAIAAPPAPALRQQHGCPCTLWPDQAVPAVASQEDKQAVELGLKFRTTSPGYISGIRFYKGAGNVGAHTGSLWSRDGQLLAQAAFTGESPSGWQRVLFGAPVPVMPGTTYVASYHTDVGHFAVNVGYFLTSGLQRGPLRALANGEDGPNGVYRYGASGFPTSTFQGSNYWVDPIFTTDATDVVAPSLASIQVTDVTPTSATIRWTTDEPSDSRVDIGQTTAYGSTVFVADQVTSHVVQVSGLAPSSSYHVRIQSRDAAGNLGSSGDFIVTTPAPVTPPARRCMPRPNVSTTLVRSGPGRLTVVVKATTNASTPSNGLTALRFLAGKNVVVDVGGQVGRTGEFTLALSGRPEQITFVIRPAVPGVAVTLPLRVIDDCGEYQTFVGGGPSAF